MTVLDAYAVIAYLRDESAAGVVADLVRARSTLSAANAAEVVDHLVRVGGWELDQVMGDLALLRAVGLQVAPVTPEIGLLAGRLRAAHYDRRHCALSLADCVAAATALVLHAPLATSDPPLAEMDRAEGGRVHGLPGSAGVVP